ncbi:single-stranded DNA-binding protein (plasmid) [Streptococcus ruminicola]|uniref:Single-stranded DNA-binding protein n=1 Tax=Streptococcus ruminicola TaxID=2686210 RepID=A0A6G8I2W9_9STRE|nr:MULTISPECIES: single-stranded DNA-binding protein [Streptococcus]QGX47391.1 single-stranded DNA-binding protein [Streptococcus equinus]QIM47439.1 single-stranded DNA-binding protein [Streptococcus ruminicola]
MNNVNLIGRTTRDVELRYTPNNTPVASVNIAVNRRFKNKETGERQTDFFPLVIWGKSAENFAKWIKKGYLISVEGELRSRNYENNQGQHVYVVEVLVSHFDNLTPRSQQNEENQVVDQQNTSTFDSFAELSSLDDTLADFATDDLPF